MPELQKFYYDTAQFYTAPRAGGSDAEWFRTRTYFSALIIRSTQAEVVAKGLREYGFSASDLHAIERDNALALFPKYKNV